MLKKGHYVTEEGGGGGHLNFVGYPAIFAMTVLVWIVEIKILQSFTTILSLPYMYKFIEKCQEVDHKLH